MDVDKYLTWFEKTPKAEQERLFERMRQFVEDVSPVPFPAEITRYAPFRAYVMKVRFPEAMPNSEDFSEALWSLYRHTMAAGSLSPQKRAAKNNSTLLTSKALEVLTTITPVCVTTADKGAHHQPPKPRGATAVLGRSSNPWWNTQHIAGKRGNIWFSTESVYDPMAVFHELGHAFAWLLEGAVEVDNYGTEGWEKHRRIPGPAPFDADYDEMYACALHLLLLFRIGVSRRRITFMLAHELNFEPESFDAFSRTQMTVKALARGQMWLQMTVAVLQTAFEICREVGARGERT